MDTKNDPSKNDPSKNNPPKNDPKDQRKPGSWDAIDEASAESFPASDPPAHHVEQKAPKTAAELAQLPPDAAQNPPPKQHK